MPPRADRVLLRERYDRRQAHVVLGAARVFARRGYDTTSVPQLADALGRASGSLYHYFPGKEDLLIAICDQLMEPLLAEVDVLLGEPAPAEAQLRAIVRLWVAHVIRHRDHLLVFQQARHLVERGEKWGKVRADRKRFERVLGSLLAEVHAADGTRLDDPRLTLSALLGMVNHLSTWYRPRGRLSAEEIADGYLALILA
jgi:AcrR family transcriptional regulator